MQITQVSRARIDQMISKGLVALRKPPKAGHSRQLTMNELAEIMVLDRLTTLGLDVAGHNLMHHMPLKLVYHAPDPALVIARLHILAPMDQGKTLSPHFQSVQSLRFTTVTQARQMLDDPDLIGVTILPLKEILDHIEAAAEELGIL
ncbi:hypothetical protein [Alterisphingorhabdus coralli]|uniref:Uncharacterized protein n=1 Tax=Alterisphingorhabdus coralli TaxID=3071408 RepID=A0AA97FAQ3_9SPHN|nr:hypothetical protein [Parasphingorhabdus sp. SCSIO 66989]WOE76298.1 hypothetical protein RB602_06185 [Parasphingorhabdus sp. SCSIO 66989]